MVEVVRAPAAYMRTPPQLDTLVHGSYSISFNNSSMTPYSTSFTSA